MSEPKTLRETRAEARAEARAKRADRRAEAARRAAASPHAQAQQSRVDALMGPLGEYFESTGFWNNGYWDADTLTAGEASENLMERLLEFLPDRSGVVLDVACGYGATTRHLLRHFRRSASRRWTSPTPSSRSAAGTARGALSIGWTRPT